jgi:hypothetical protein
MNSTLFPHRVRFFGWPLLIVGVVSGTIWIFSEYSLEFLDIHVLSLIGNDSIVSGGDKPRQYLTVISDNFTNELIALVTLFGAFLVAFSKEKIEDEFFQQLRFESIIWALKVQAVLLFFGILFLYSFAFLSFMMIALMSFFILYIGRYHYRLMKYRNASYEE